MSRSAPWPLGSRPLWRVLDRIAWGVQTLVLGGAVVAVLAATVPQLRHWRQARPTLVPPAMEPVDWHDPGSSIYCLACHRQVAPAAGGLEVRRGHSQNVVLNATQLAAVREMGTVVGPGDTLICMTCHRLGAEGADYMLAASLADSGLCQRCHPGHYAQGTPHDLRVSAPGERNRFGQTAGEAGPCSACHLAHSFAREIIPSPLDPDGYCISCHRAYQVAAGHQRTTMEHPESHCLQCHNPHDATHGQFLRQPAAELCVRCHIGFADGPGGGMHPLGPTARAVPAELRVGPHDPGTDVTCLTCHAVHEAGHERLLRLPRDSNELCLRCHAEALAAGTLHGDLPRHGQSPPLDAPQRAVVARWNGRVGPGGELLCLSCHRVHGAAPHAQLLADRPHYGDSCVACHPQAAGVFGTPHDLRTNFPRLANVAGLTPLDGGACGACHLAHRPGRAAAPGPGDPTGTCQTCHRGGECGQAKLAGGATHPQTACTGCHDPHERSHGQFLARPVADLCQTCHADAARLVGGPHDLTRFLRGGPGATAPAALTPTAAALAQHGPCLPCHVPHGGARADLFRVGGAEPVGNHDDVCLSCHADTAWQADSPVAALHPQRINPEASRVNLALVPTDETGALRLGCRTCHDPHAGAQPAHLARVAPGEPGQALCLSCHVEKQYIRHTGHSAEKLAAVGFEADSCRPCHAMHARPDGTWGQMLSPRFLEGRCDDVPELEGESCLPCMACHRAGGPAPLRRFIAHPKMVMMNITQPGEPGHLPLFGPDGREDPQGQVVCRTCHLSHGRLDLLKVLDQNPDFTPEQQHAVRAQVRPFVAPNVCTACHGAAARNKFLFFHDARVRGAAPASGPAPR